MLFCRIFLPLRELLFLYRDLHLIPVHLSRPVNSSTHPRLALSRAEMVEQLIINHGICNEKQR